ncbi:hypothetical protein Sjap_023217 [Stephania japonica]|uniref:Atos-like conserved domain-containing protein n=1 Tax=Stephania japonica TaxID=461633 RepID=A0AAP0EB83_9MAGN
MGLPQSTSSQFIDVVAPMSTLVQNLSPDSGLRTCDFDGSLQESAGNSMIRENKQRKFQYGQLLNRNNGTSDDVCSLRIESEDQSSPGSLSSAVDFECDESSSSVNGLQVTRSDHSSVTASSGNDLFSLLARADLHGEESVFGSQTEAVAISPKRVYSSPLSLSPLGRKVYKKIGIADSRKEAKRKTQVEYERSGDMSDRLSGILLSTDNTDLVISGKSFLDIDMMSTNFDSCTPECSDSLCQHWFLDSAPKPRLSKSRTLSGSPVRRSLVGSFEESLLSGHLSSGIIYKKIEGFQAVLNVTGGSFSPLSRKLPFSVSSVDGNACLLYYASVDLAGNSPSKQSKDIKVKRNRRDDESREAQSRLRIPVKGCIQLTFLRQKITINSSGSVSKITQANLVDGNSVSSGGIDIPHSKKPRNQSSEESSQAPQCPFDMIENSKQQQKNDWKELHSSFDRCHEFEGRSVHSSNLNGHCTVAGVLRYAIHLRFRCPSKRKNLRSKKKLKCHPLTACETNILDVDGERRFYLYNDLRIVFPQRHSDADEGKFNVEYHFPDNPKYFYISN